MCPFKEKDFLFTSFRIIQALIEIVVPFSSVMLLPLFTRSMALKSFETYAIWKIPLLRSLANPDSLINCFAVRPVKGVPVLTDNVLLAAVTLIARPFNATGVDQSFHIQPEINSSNTFGAISIWSPPEVSKPVWTVSDTCLFELIFCEEIDSFEN